MYICIELLFVLLFCELDEIFGADKWIKNN